MGRGRVGKRALAAHGYDRPEYSRQLFRVTRSPAVIKVVVESRVVSARPTGSVGHQLVRNRQGQQLRTFAFGQSTPDAVRLMDLKGMGPAGGQGGTVQADGLGLSLATRAGRPSLTLGVEEKGTRHSATGGMQLPIPQIGVRAGQAPGVSHIDPLAVGQTGVDRTRCEWIRQNPTAWGVAARSAARSNHRRPEPRGKRCGGRIRADPGAVAVPTLECFSAPDKTLIMKFMILIRCPKRLPTTESSLAAQVRGWGGCRNKIDRPMPSGRSPRGVNGQVNDAGPLLSAVGVTQSRGNVTPYPIMRGMSP